MKHNNQFEILNSLAVKSKKKGLKINEINVNTHFIKTMFILILDKRTCVAAIYVFGKEFRIRTDINFCSVFFSGID